MNVEDAVLTLLVIAMIAFGVGVVAYTRGEEAAFERTMKWNADTERHKKELMQIGFDGMIIPAAPNENPEYTQMREIHNRAIQSIRGFYERQYGSLKYRE